MQIVATHFVMTDLMAAPRDDRSWRSLRNLSACWMTNSYLLRLLDAVLAPELLFAPPPPAPAAPGRGAAGAGGTDADAELDWPDQAVLTTSGGTMLTRRCCKRRRMMRGINFSATHVRSDGGLAGREAPWCLQKQNPIIHYKKLEFGAMAAWVFWLAVSFAFGTLLFIHAKKWL